MKKTVCLRSSGCETIMLKPLSCCCYDSGFSANPRRRNNLSNLKNNDGTLIFCIGAGILKPYFFLPQITPTFQIIFMTILFVIAFPASLTTATPVRMTRSHAGDTVSAGLILKKHSTPMTVKVAFLHPRTFNASTKIFNTSTYHTSPSILPTKLPPNITPPRQQGVAQDVYNNNDDSSSSLIPVFVLSNTSESTMATPETTRSKNVNLAVIPVLGIFFLMILVCFKGCSWFREHLKEHDIEDDGKDYVILSPPEDGYREVEFRSDTSSMYYDTVSSYRSILRQKGEYGGYNNYDTVTSIRSVLQRADVRDAAVQVRLQGQRPDRWKSVSGILNNGDGSNSDLLRVPKKTHRQVSFQTSHNETYDPPPPRMCDVNIQVGDSTMERLKQQQEKTSKFQNGILPRQISPGYGSRSCLASSLPNRHSSASLRSMDRPESHPLKRTDSSGCASTTSNSTAASTGSNVPGKAKNRRIHHFQVLRVNSTDRLGSREIERMDPSPIRPAVITPHYIDQNRSASGLALDKSADYQDRAERPSSASFDNSRGELYGAPMTTMCHPHYFCDQFVQTDSDSANDTMSPVTAAAHTSVSPPILTEVKLSHARSEDEDSDELNGIKKLDTDCLRHELYIDESSDTTGEESLVTSGRNSANWSEQLDEEDQLQKLLQAHASAIAGAPIASSISLESSSSCRSSTDDVAQRLELDRSHQTVTEAGDATTTSEDSGEGRSGFESRLGPGNGQTENDEPKDEETPLIERSFTDISSSPYSQSPVTGPGTLNSTRPHRVSSGYDTQGPESSSVKGPAEAGDSSCDVTPLTSSSNSLQECGREAGKGGIHSHLPLQLLLFQHVQEERKQAQKPLDFESRHQSPLSRLLKNTDTGRDEILMAPNLDQPSSYIPQPHPQDTNNNISTPRFNSNNNTFPRQRLGSTDNNFSKRSSSLSMDNIQLKSPGSNPPTPTDCLGEEPTVGSISQISGNGSVGIRNSDSSSSMKTLSIKDSVNAPVTEIDDPLRTGDTTETSDHVLKPLSTLPPLPPSAKNVPSYQARKPSNTATDSTVLR